MTNHVSSKSNNLNTLIKDISLARTLNGVLILFLATQISIPLNPVPITLQTAGVMLIGLTYSRKEAVSSVLLYIGLGVLGLPMFTNFSGGITKFMGPTGGYLVGFLAAVAIMTTIRQYSKDKNLLIMVLSCTIGTIIIFLFGIAWLSTFVGIEKAIQVGFVPFIITGIVKIAITAAAVRYVKFGKSIK